MSASAFVDARRRPAIIATIIVLGLLALLTAFSWSSRASATSPYPPQQACSVSTSDTTVTAGSTISVNGSGFGADQTVTLSLHSAAAIPLGTVRTDASGSFSTTVTIPATLQGTNHHIEAATASKSCHFDPFTSGSGTGGVTATRGVSSTHGLAYTGFAAITASVIGLALVAGGFMFVIIGRRRRA